jgi:hypothetical protein
MATSSSPKKNPSNLYRDIIEAIFFKHYKKGATVLPFDRDEIVAAANSLGGKLPKNLGDVIYSLRYRVDFPEKVVATAATGMEWAIVGVGRAKYAFKQFPFHRLIPRDNLLSIKIPDATPEIIVAYALDDEQALLAKVRYNRLVDIFLGITTYSLQNHLRTSVKDIGQIEIDEVYVGVDRHGRHFIVPVQAKGGTDKHGVVQTLQDLQFCAEKYPQLVCRCVSAQFMADNRIAMFELTLQDESVKVIEEKHYQLVPSANISADDLNLYRAQTKA